MDDPYSQQVFGARRTGRIGIGLTLDSVHFKILDVLRTHGRISIAALAERVGVSRANAYSRFEALRADGVLTGFSARIDPARVGFAPRWPRCPRSSTSRSPPASTTP
jgi:DNA-binding Lrp family transcriptional regulator